MYFGFGGWGERAAVSSRQVPRSRPSWPGGMGKHARARRYQMPCSAWGLPSCGPSSGRGASCPQPWLPPAAGVVRISAGLGGDPTKPHLCVSGLLTRLRNCPSGCFAHELSPLTPVAHLPWGHRAFPSVLERLSVLETLTLWMYRNPWSSTSLFPSHELVVRSSAISLPHKHFLNGRL